MYKRLKEIPCTISYSNSNLKCALEEEEKVTGKPEHAHIYNKI